MNHLNESVEARKTGWLGQLGTPESMFRYVDLVDNTTDEDLDYDEAGNKPVDSQKRDASKLPA